MMRAHRLAPYAIIVFVATTGCPDDEPSPPSADRDGGTVRDGGSGERDAGAIEVAQACAPPNAELQRGDINGDGHVNVADAIALESHRYRGGRAPVCEPAADFNRDGRVEADDSHAITSWLTTGAHPLSGNFNSRACDPVAEYWENAPCAPIAWKWMEPQKRGTMRATIQVAIEHPTTDIQGWSVGFAADGCTIDAISNQGTIAAEVWDDPPGIRHLGYSASVPLPDGAISVVKLSFNEPVILAASAAPTPVLTLSVSAEACGRCTLGTFEGLRWTGQPIENVFVAEGVGYAPEPASTQFDICTL